MFTGLVEETGTTVDCVREARSARLTIAATTVYAGARLGESIAVNGCCLTVVGIDGNRLTFDAIPETLDRTNLGALRQGDPVNLERPLAASARLDGHFVQGHIDGLGVVRSLTPEDNAVVVEIEPPSSLLRYFVEKGSVAVDGVSLTVAAVSADAFTVWTIPHTRQVTTLGRRSVGDTVNLECDILGKYIERLLEARGALGDPVTATN
jgi:riboflavin synthase